MKVLLADPPDAFLRGDGLTRQVQPLGLAYVGAALARRHDVRFLLPDTRAYRGDDPWGEIAGAIAAESPDVVGLGAVTATFPAACRLARLVKEIDPSVPVVLGGAHASAEALGAARREPAIDFVVRGEGEKVMARLVDALDAGATGQAGEWAEIPGLLWRGRADGSIHPPAAPEPPNDLDRLALPLRTGLVWSDDVTAGFYEAMVTARGCPYGCIYCGASSRDRPVRFRSPENVADEVAHLREHFDVRNLFFHDSVFTLDRRRTLSLCGLLVARGLAMTFQCQTRVDCVDGELLAAMRAAGCRHVLFGIESGDERTLERIGKGIGLETIRRAVRMVKALGIRATGFFMIGLPWETPAEMERTVEFACDLGLDAVNLFSATPLPGTKLWEMVSDRRRTLPECVDFRTPQVNLTALDDAAYAGIFRRAQARFDDYNRSQATVASRQPGDLPL